jgi:cytochrome o ubiquinol oxidase subunit 1
MFLMQIIVGFLQRQDNMDYTGDPWDSRTLEWSTSSPAPFYNFAHVPEATVLTVSGLTKKMV